MGPITNVLGAAGEIHGEEWAALGVLFRERPGHHFNIGCGSGVGDPDNCLSADRVWIGDFDGTVIASFVDGDVRQVTDSVIIDYAIGTTSTVIRDSFGNVLLDQTSGDVSFTASGIASVEMQFRFDGANAFSFGALSFPSGSGVVQTGARSRIDAALVRLRAIERWFERLEASLWRTLRRLTQVDHATVLRGHPLLASGIGWVKR